MASPDYARWFKDIRARDIASVGGKNASLGEMYSTLSSQGVQVPNGFALTAGLYRDALTAANAWPRLTALLQGVGGDDVARLASAAAEARSIVHAATGTDQVRTLLAENYRRLEDEYGKGVAVAVRSSATAEDLPTASFAGQHESFLNVRGVDELFDACRQCFASVFTDRAIVYRNENGFDHLKIGLSVGIMKMVRSDEAASGVVFTLDTESGFPDVVFVTGAWGLGENIVQGRVDPDEFYVHKPTFRAGHRCVLRRSLGGKQRKLVYADGHGANSTVNVDTPAADRERFCINDAEVLKLADYALRIEEHYSRLAGHDVPMDIEWAKDGPDGDLFIVQARPETVASRKSAAAFETFRLQGSGPVLLVGRAVGEKAASGVVCVIADPKDLATFRSGDVLVAETTSPDWEPIMKKAAAIVTDRGGRTCHAAIV
ncbi:MAG: PEP/pyruvate-binding domain-containing protein, partial [Reyranella sp.]